MKDKQVLESNMKLDIDKGFIFQIEHVDSNESQAIVRIQFKSFLCLFVLIYKRDFS